MPARRLTYHEIAADLAVRIDTGEYKIGEKLPSYPELQDMYSVSRSTVSRAVNELRTLGYVEGFAGVGVYVKRRGRPGHV